MEIQGRAEKEPMTKIVVAEEGNGGFHKSNGAKKWRL